jgi:THO complex subunit 4
MPDKLSQSLDQILSERRKTTRHPRAGRRPGTKPATAAPVGGVKKAVKGEKKVERATPTGPAGGVRGESKIIVSNLVSIALDTVTAV